MHSQKPVDCPCKRSAPDRTSRKEGTDAPSQSPHTQRFVTLCSSSALLHVLSSLAPPNRSPLHSALTYPVHSSFVRLQPQRRRRQERSTNSGSLLNPHGETHLQLKYDAVISEQVDLVNGQCAIAHHRVRFVLKRVRQAGRMFHSILEPMQVCYVERT